MSIIIKSEIKTISTEELFTGAEINMTIPDNPQRKDYSKSFSLRDEAFDAKNVADQYRDLIRDGLIKAADEFREITVLKYTWR